MKFLHLLLLPFIIRCALCQQPFSVGPGKQDAQRIDIDTDIDADPEQEPSVEPSPEEGEDFLREDFLGAAFRRSESYEISYIIADPSDPSASSKVDVKATLRDAGVVSLSGLHEYLTEIICMQSGKVRIKLNADAPVGDSVQEMYPEGAILAVDYSLFGDCVIAPRAAGMINQEDSFMLIKSVEGTKRDAVLSVELSFFDAMFKEFSVSIKRTEISGAGTLARLETSAIERREGTAKLAIITLKQEIGAGVSAAVQIKFTPYVVYQEFTSKWKASEGRRVFELKYQDGYEFSGTAKLSFETALEIPFEKVVTTIPIYGISVKLFGVPIGGFVLPPLKLGFLDEISFVAKATFKLTSTWQPTFVYKASKKDNVSVSGSLFPGLIPRISVNKPIRTPFIEEQRDFAVKSLSPKIGESPKFSFSVFVGVKNAVQFTVPLLDLQVRANLGVGLETAAGKPPFAPFSSGLKIGTCETCHVYQVKMNAKLDNIGIDARIGKLVKEFDFKILSVTVPFGAICIKDPFDGRGETCGQSCCDPLALDICEAQSFAFGPTCKSSHSLSTDDIYAQVFTDPHIRTFDGLRYGCQATGEFILTKSVKKNFEVQARFYGPNPMGSVTTGVAISMQSLPIFQISVTSEASPASTMVWGCPVVSFVGGSPVDITASSTNFGGASVFVSSSRVSINYDSGFSVSFKIGRLFSFGCAFSSLKIRMPRAMVADDIRGLFGTPNSDQSDDWTDPDGASLSPPANVIDRQFEGAYKYCTTNWCIQNRADSLFTYEPGLTFSEINKCDREYAGLVDFNSIPPATQALCDGDEACLFDASVGGEEAALLALGEQREFNQLFQPDSTLTLTPSVIKVGVPTFIKAEIVLPQAQETLASLVNATLGSSAASASLPSLISETVASLGSLSDIPGISASTAAAFNATIGSLSSPGAVTPTLPGFPTDPLLLENFLSNMFPLTRKDPNGKLQVVVSLRPEKDAEGRITSTYSAIFSIQSSRPGDVFEFGLPSVQMISASTSVRSVPDSDNSAASITTSASVSTPFFDDFELHVYFFVPLEISPTELPFFVPTALTFLGNTFGPSTCFSLDPFVTMDGTVQGPYANRIDVKLGKALKAGKWSGSTTINLLYDSLVQELRTIRAVLVKNGIEMPETNLHASVIPGKRENSGSFLSFVLGTDGGTPNVCPNTKVADIRVEVTDEIGLTLTSLDGAATNRF